MGARGRFLFLLALAVWPVSAPAVRPASQEMAPPRAEEILAKLLERAERTEASPTRYLYKQRSVVEHMNKEGEAERREETLHEAVLIGDEVYLRLVERGGKPLAGNDLKKEQEREAKFRRAAEKAKGKAGKKKEDEDEIVLSAELVNRYTWELLGREPMDGRPAFLLAFAPKGGALPRKSRMDDVLNKVRGRLWVDAEEYEVARLEAETVDTVKMWGGLLARVNGLKLAYGQKRRSAEEWLPETADVTLRLRALVFFSQHMRMRLMWSDYRKAGPTAAQGKEPKAKD